MAACLDRALGHAEADDGQRAGGAGDDDVVLRHVLAEFVEADGGAVVALGQRPATLDGAVGDGDLLRLAGAEVGGAQLDHLAGTDEQDALGFERFENAFGQMHAGGGHRHDVGADRRRRANLLGDREGVLEQFVQLCAERAVFFGDAHRVLHLAENLRLADDHRIEAAGDAEGMADRFRLVVGVDVRGDVLAPDLVILGQPVDHYLRRFGGAVDFGTVAGGQDRHLAHRPVARQVGQRVRKFVGAKRHALANGEWGGAVVDAEGKDHRIGLGCTERAPIIAFAPSQPRQAAADAGSGKS